METYNVHAAKSQLSALIAKAEAGEEVIISRANKPVVKLVPVTAPPAPRCPGLGRDDIEFIAADFDDTPEELAADWYGDA